MTTTNEYLKAHRALIVETWESLVCKDSFEVVVAERWGTVKKMTFDGEEIKVYHLVDHDPKEEPYWKLASEDIYAACFIEMYQKPWLHRVISLQDGVQAPKKEVEPITECHHLFLNEEDEMWVRNILCEKLYKVPRTTENLTAAETEKFYSTLMVVPRFQFLTENIYEMGKFALPSIETLLEYFSEKEMHIMGF